MKDKIVFKGRLLKLSVKKERLPNGFLAHFEMITHPGAALVIPFLSKDKIIILRQLRPVIGQYIYELPAGTLNKNEAPLACAKREIIEETGYSAKKFSCLGAIYPVPGYSTEKIFIYKALGLTKKERLPEEDEVIESMVVTRNQVKRLFKTGKITDAKTISALAFAGWL
jgi:ADP-ribose pyrophosphatase